MKQQQPDERPATEANVDKLLDELHQLAKYAMPVEQRQESGSPSSQQPSIVAKGR